MVFCQNCGSEVNPADTFCSVCGEQIKAVKQTNYTPPPQQPVYDSSPPQQPAYGSSPP
ncbi:MAG: zinc-ribbon domain-containing protein, partial [Candidatus Hodarchaeales archaeon]